MLDKTNLLRLVRRSVRCSGWCLAALGALGVACASFAYAGLQCADALEKWRLADWTFRPDRVYLIRYMLITAACLGATCMSIALMRSSVARAWRSIFRD